MGTQQIILIILGVIIVGVAVALGIYMFGNQAVNSSRLAMIHDMNHFSSQARAWWITPLSMGGGGRVEYLSGGGGDWTNYIDLLGLYLGNNFNTQGNTINTMNGTYQILYGGKYSVKFIATGYESNKGNPVEVELIYNMATDSTSVNIIN